ncbi:hypothetical protein SMC44_002659 [Cronobacter malonaticus]|nr:hypothetical protein [Cronobacter malonaticus]
MKLIDLLVQESKKGNLELPVNAVGAVQDDDGQICFSKSLGVRIFDGQWTDGDWCTENPFHDVTAGDFATSIITREQYESALAAAQQPVWDGEGLPPVGCECEARFILGGKWFFFRCVAVDCGIAFGWAGKEAVTLDKGSYEFRPIRSEADKRRDEAISALVDFKIGYHSYPKAAEEYLREVTALYDAILRGEIPHIRIEQAA